jgi:hypothetical protein
VNRIRILVAVMPGILRDIIASVVASQPDMELAGEVRAPERLSAAAERTGANVVIVGRRDAALSDECRQLLYDLPGLTTLAVTDYDRGAFFCELRPHRVQLADLSTDQLVEVIRAAGAVRDGAR